MKSFLILSFLLFTQLAISNTWSYQVNINNKSGKIVSIDSDRNPFDAGPYYCEVSPVSLKNSTEYRSLTCAVGSGTVSTGGLCTRKNHKFPSLQYAILNLNGTKNFVNVVVACHFDKK